MSGKEGHYHRWGPVPASQDFVRGLLIFTAKGRFVYKKKSDSFGPPEILFLDLPFEQIWRVLLRPDSK